MEGTPVNFTPDPQLPPEKWPSLIVVACTVWGESRGEKLEAKIAVGLVIRNRSNNDKRWDGTDWKSTCLRDYQFSCWNAGDPNRAKLARPLENDMAQTWLDCLTAARIVMEDGLMFDLTRGSDHYYDVSLDQAGRPPAWSKVYGFTRQIGRLKFYKS